jgi:hypothetical protein
VQSASQRTSGRLPQRHSRQGAWSLLGPVWPGSPAERQAEDGPCQRRRGHSSGKQKTCLVRGGAGTAAAVAGRSQGSRQVLSTQSQASSSSSGQPAAQQPRHAHLKPALRQELLRPGPAGHRHMPGVSRGRRRTAARQWGRLWHNLPVFRVALHGVGGRHDDGPLWRMNPGWQGDATCQWASSSSSKGHMLGASSTARLGGCGQLWSWVTSQCQCCTSSHEWWSWSQQCAANVCQSQP